MSQDDFKSILEVMKKLKSWRDDLGAIPQEADVRSDQQCVAFH